MRNTIVITASVLLGMLTLLILSTILGRLDRRMELESNLSSIVEEIVEDMVLNSYYVGKSADVVKAELHQMLSKAIDAPSDIVIDIHACDMEKGILSVCVTLSYRHPNESIGAIVCEKCVILNQLVQEVEEKCRVSFYVGADLYKEYVVAKETIVDTPVSPLIENGAFYGWVDETGRIIDFSKPIMQDIICFAITG